MEEVGGLVLHLAKRRRMSAFKKLVQHYEQPVYQMSYICLSDSVLAEELARDTFIYAYNELSHSYRKEIDFSIWLFQIVACLARKRFRDNLPKEPGYSLLNVSLEGRISLFLHHVCELSHSDIGKVLGKREAEIPDLFKAGREALRERLECEEQVLSS